MSVRGRRLAFWSAIGLLLAAGLSWAFYPRPVAVDLVDVVRGPFAVTVEAEGKTRVREIYAVSAPLTARLDRIVIHAGDTVTGGETVVARLQPTDPTFLDIRTRAQAESAIKAATAALALAEAELERVRSERALAQSELARIRELERRGVATRAELDRLSTVARTRVAAEAAAEAALRVREFELETARAFLIEPGEDRGPAQSCCVEVRAPISGRVLRVLQESDAVIVAGTPLLEIGDPSDLEIVMDLLSTDAVQVKAGAPASLTAWGGDNSLTARVRHVEPFGFTKVSALGVDEQRVNVVLDLVSPHAEWAALGHGFKVFAAIEIWREEAVVHVPLGAVFRDGEAWAAFVAEAGRTVLRPVQLGRSNGVAVEIRAGLEPGETVILHPSDTVRSGVRVAPRQLVRG